MLRTPSPGLAALLLSGCTLFNLENAPSPATAAAPAPARARTGARGPKVATASAKHGEASRGRRVGDYFVQRFSGSYRETPLVVTEEVIAREDDAFVVDYTFEEGTGTTELRARVARGDGAVLAVSRLDGDTEIPVGREALDSMLQETLFSPDINEALLETKGETCLVGMRELDCQLHAYRVVVGEETMTLTVADSESVPGRDVAGEVVTLDGKVIYRTELIDMGNDAPDKALARAE